LGGRCLVADAWAVDRSVPITTRLDEDTVDSLDRAVRAGAGPSRAAVLAEAVHEWLARHSEQAIAASYRRAYDEADAEHEDLVARLGTYAAGVAAEAEQ
jgi:Arc/MetJ-type ribon-helix-helix transcriptional regulator